MTTTEILLLVLAGAMGWLWWRTHLAVNVVADHLERHEAMLKELQGEVQRIKDHRVRDGG